MKKIRIRAILKSTKYKKCEKTHNETLYENKEGRVIYLSLERDSYNLNTAIYGREKARTFLLNYLQKGIIPN